MERSPTASILKLNPVQAVAHLFPWNKSTHFAGLCRHYIGTENIRRLKSGGWESRTPDLLRAKETLYQLSQAPVGLLVYHPVFAAKLTDSYTEQVVPMSFDLNSLRLKVPKVLRIKIFADGADKGAILKRYEDPNIAGFTTNPTLMKKSGVSDYEAFAKDVLTVVKNKQISFEVFSDEWDEMEAQAKTISSWGENVVIKIPITNTKGEGAQNLIERLAKAGVKLNITAITTVAQVKSIAPLLGNGHGGIVSVFAGRIADSGRDPVPVMKECLEALKAYPNTELLWASPRELYNLIQAEDMGCHIITMTEDLLKKMPLLGGDLDQVSLDTVNMFYTDAQAAGFNIKATAGALARE
ncbi:unnamed protein product [Sphagnum jensenii]